MTGYATTSGRSHAKRDAPLYEGEGERKPPRPEVVSDLAALAILALLEEHTIGLRLLLSGVMPGELPDDVLAAIKDHAASCERLTGALEAS